MSLVFGIVGWKNCGKTTLTERLISEFTGRGLQVSTIKHAHHSVDVDQPGTDSYRHRKAGAHEVILAGGPRFALMHECRGAIEPDLDSLLVKLSPCDLVLVEGYKFASHAKIEVSRQVAQKRLLALDDMNILAVASDYPVEVANRVVKSLNDVTGIADFIWEHRR